MTVIEPLQDYRSFCRPESIFVVVFNYASCRSVFSMCVDLEDELEFREPRKFYDSRREKQHRQKKKE